MQNPLQISSISSGSPGTTNATITWTTSDAASSTVLYGTTTSYGSASSSANYVTSHSITLSGLTQDTTYHFQILDSDSFGNSATSSDQTFTTASLGPLISDIAATPQTATSTVAWTTSENATSEVVYGPTTSYGSSTSSASLSTSHSLSLTGLQGGTTYHFAVVSTGGGYTSTSSDQTFVSSTTPYIGSNGWTVFSPSPGTGSCSAGTYTGTCIVYVSASTGNDSTCAPVAPPVNESGVTPCATIAKAKTLMRNNYPDWMLLKRGDTFVNQSFSCIENAMNGRSADELELISSYGTSGASPLIEVNGGNDTNGCSDGISDYNGSPAYNYAAIVGLNFYAYTRDPSSPNFAPSTLANNTPGFSFLPPFDWMLIEGNTFNFFGENVIEGTDNQSNVTIRRNVIENDYSSSEGHSQGLFASEVSDLVIEDNVFDHNGWNGTLITPAPVMISVASPAVITWNGNDLSDNSQIEFSSTGSLPTGFASSTDYCVMNLSGSTFNVYNDGGNCAGDGTAIDASGSQSGTQYGIWEDPAPTIFNRSIYLSHDPGTVYDDNIDAEGSSGGIQQREGGTTDNNLFLQDPISIAYGSDENATGTVSGAIDDNVILDAQNVGATQPQGTAITIASYFANADGDIGGQSLVDGLDVSDNLVAHQQHGTENISAFDFGGGGPFTKTTVHNNVVYDWGNGLAGNGASGFYVSIPVSGSSGNTFEDNQIQMPNGATIGSTDGTSGGSITLSGNSYYSTNPTNEWFYDNTGDISTSTWNTEMRDTGASYSPVSYTDDARDIQTYDSSQLSGPGTFADFMAGADAQSYEDWNPAYTPEVVNNWIRAGYGLPQI